jgi:hypothetical protein
MVALKFKKVGIKRVGPKSPHQIQKAVAVQKVRMEFKKLSPFKKYVRSSKRWESKSSPKTKNRGSKSFKKLFTQSKSPRQKVTVVQKVSKT